MAKAKSATGRELHDLFEEVFHLQAVLATVVDHVHEEAGLGSPHQKVAEILARRGPSTVPEVAAEMEVSRQFVQTVCYRLEEQGLVEFSPNPRHKRSRLVSLTKQGQATLDEVRRKEAAIVKSALPKVERRAVIQARDTLLSLGEQLTAKLRKTPNQPS
ncbi:MAG: MarR family transcriptional regulator [Desulfarculaceae bacterium]|nr:MarR family transcriptional regulator [Desulfarculaceae bacterium]MCF8074335.1 MarR family transcriptional regulator [Desulfarculaceae bacterium]MCF8103565.1 MarR family transcriptional regulator [Desulfarculaceae bacterium]MCF8117332.1 MarR family transcriptional regulator [Desulfarculaceae bacterium]